jgi:hypothetical protein
VRLALSVFSDNLADTKMLMGIKTTPTSNEARSPSVSKNQKPDNNRLDMK